MMGCFWGHKYQAKDVSYMVNKNEAQFTLVTSQCTRCARIHQETYSSYLPKELFIDHSRLTTQQLNSK